MESRKEIQLLENRVQHLEGILSALLASNYHILVGGKEWVERCIEIMGQTANKEGQTEVKR